MPIRKVLSDLSVTKMRSDWKNTVITLISTISETDLERIEILLLKEKQGENLRTIFFEIYQKGRDGGDSFSKTFSSKVLSGLYQKLLKLIPKALSYQRANETIGITLEVEEALFYIDRGLYSFGFNLGIQVIQTLFEKEDFNGVETLYSALTHALYFGELDNVQRDQFEELWERLEKMRLGKQEFDRLYAIYINIMVAKIAPQKEKAGGIDPIEIGKLKESIKGLSIPTISQKALFFYHYIFAFLNRADSNFTASLFHTKAAINIYESQKWLRLDFPQFEPMLPLQGLNDAYLVGNEDESLMLLGQLKDKYSKYPKEYCDRLLLGLLFKAEHSDQDSLLEANDIFQLHLGEIQRNTPPNRFALTVYSLLKLNYFAGNHEQARRYLRISMSIQRSNQEFEVMVFTKIFEIVFAFEESDWDDVFRLANNLRRIINYSPEAENFPIAKLIVNFFMSVGRLSGRNIANTGIKTLSSIENETGSMIPELAYFDFKVWYKGAILG